MWATSLRDRFQGTGVTPLQAENKWKTLEQAYKRVKYHNSRSGHQRRTCDHEEELAEILEPQHHIQPCFVAGPGQARTSSNLDEDPLPGPSNSQQAPCNEDGRPPARKRTRRMADAVAESFAAIAAKLDESRHQRHGEKMEAQREKLALLERLVCAVEKTAEDTKDSTGNIQCRY
ncbi:uncharacterized protein LOC144119485 [Amblyomma americanum]